MGLIVFEIAIEIDIAIEIKFFFGNRLNSVIIFLIRRSSVN